MYERTGRYYRSQRKREEIEGYLQTAMLILTIISIIVVCATIAFQTRRAAHVEAAEPAALQTFVTIDEGYVMDVARAMTVGMTPLNETVLEQIQDEAERKIVIDPGHGGMDGGCVFDDVEEKDINRQIAWEVTRKLRKMGYKVELVRKGDNDREKLDRVDQANRDNALLYVSIHQNSCEVDSVSGIETWYGENDKSDDSRRLAKLIQQETVKSTGAVNRELVSDAELCVVNKSNMPSCLIETGFLSNKKEREKLCTEEYRDQVAEGIAKGIDLYLNPKTMYLTFDDGPSEEYTDMVLDVLKDKNVKATFFVIGEYVRKYPETAKRIVEEGHTIGIHCDVHDYKRLYASVDSYIEDFEKAYDTVYEVTGVKAQFFRFPGGSINDFNKTVYKDIIAEMESRGFVYYDWNASLEDATRSKATSEDLISTAMDTARGRQSVVMLAHDRVGNTAYTLGELIDTMAEYRIEPLTLEVKPVQF